MLLNLDKYIKLLEGRRNELSFISKKTKEKDERVVAKLEKEKEKIKEELKSKPLSQIEAAKVVDTFEEDLSQLLEHVSARNFWQKNFKSVRIHFSFCNLSSKRQLLSLGLILQLLWRIFLCHYLKSTCEFHWKRQKVIMSLSLLKQKSKRHYTMT